MLLWPALALVVLTPADLSGGWMPFLLLSCFLKERNQQALLQCEGIDGADTDNFLVTFTTLLAMINPLESITVFLKLLEGKDEKEHCQVARRCCFYAMLMMLFFVLFGTIVLKIFGVPLSMVRIVGGIILVKIGFEMFLPSSSEGMFPSPGGEKSQGEDYAFVPLAIPIMFGPGALATVLGMSSMVRNPIANLGL